MKKRKICFVYTEWASRPDQKYGGVGYYRCVNPAKAISDRYDAKVFGKDLALPGETTEEMWTRLYSEYDAVVVKAVDSEMGAAAACFFAKHFGKRLILDLDDNYIEVRPDQPGYADYHAGSQKRAIHQALLSQVDGLIVSTKPLADFYADRVRKVYGQDIPVFVAPNFTDPNDWPEPKRPRRKVIGYAGSITHNADLATVMPTLARMMRSHGDWHFEVLGGVRSEDIPTVFKDFDELTIRRVHIKNGTPSWKGYPELLRDQRWNVGIAPLVDDEFNRGKSHIKWMEYSMCGIATLASEVYPYSEPINGTPTVEHGRTGLLFKDSKGFEQHLCSLMEDGKMRDEMAREARAAVIGSWGPADHSEEWHKAIETVCNSPTRPINWG